VRAPSLSLAFAALSACGPAWAPPNAPAHACAIISAAEYEAAIAAGATRATARIGADGMVSMETGPGAKQCATFRNSTIRPCRRPNDFAIRYEPADSEAFHVLVPAGEEYRFRIQNLPNTCEILEH
jgi:hypothetical protein